ncbi:MAG TPA: dihydrodipicolinate reductase C-terminal domain-containing protein [Candidatus Limnocylindrales bacterium]|jgi:4-hydroxy-tetrahydrodipicolinate reductase
MQLLIYGPGRLGGAIAAAAVATGWPDPQFVERPAPVGRPATIRADVVVDASRSGAVAVNVEHALAAGNRAFVLATSGWEADIPRVRALLLDAGAVAILAPNLSLGASLFMRLAETAAAWYGRAGDFEPSIVEWHRRGKADRPSGTARSLARRIAAVDPRWVAVDPGEVADRGAIGGATDGRVALEVASIRAGSEPGTHLVTFDGTGESIELRLAARDRSAYAEGALASARWLVREPRAPGIHPFDEVVDDLLAASPLAVPA